MDASLEDRVRHLERSNRRLKLLGLLLGLAAVTCGGGVTSNFALVRTGQLDIVDGNDVVLVSIGGRPGAHITFNDDEGQVQLDAETLRKLIKEPGPNATP